MEREKERERKTRDWTVERGAKIGRAKTGQLKVCIPILHFPNSTS